MDEIVLRRLRVDDAEAVAALSEGLGYPATAEKVQSRLEYVVGSNERLAIAAVWRGVLIGWIDAALEHHLQSETVITIGGLVVRSDMRGKKIGQQLCLAVETWAGQIGIGIIRVRSHQKRTDAHRFYARDGYKQVKTSLVFEKDISSNLNQACISVR